MKTKGPFTVETIWDPPAAGGGGSPSFSGVVAPTATSDNKATGVALSNKTFSAFTDPNSLIASYQAVNLQIDGSCSWSGTGLGPYTPTSADGDDGVLYLHAKDASGNILATAIHGYSRDIAAVSGGAWTSKHSVDLTSLTPTTLTSGSQVVDGYTIYCNNSGQTLSASGLSTGNAQPTYVKMDGYLTDMNRPVLAIATVDVTWSGTGLSSSIRGRMFSALNAASPSYQLRCDALASDVRNYIQWNARTVGGTGTFTTSGSYDLGSKPTTLYLHMAFVQGLYIAWLAASRDVPAGINDIMAGAADRIYVMVTAASNTATPWWNSDLYVGVYRESSTAYITNIEVLEWQD